MSRCKKNERMKETKKGIINRNKEIIDRKKETTDKEKETMNRRKQIISSELTWQPQKEIPPILNKISIQLESGGFYGIIGANGSGKTSLLRHILHFIELQEGSIQIDKKEINSYEPLELAKCLSFVPQNTAIDTSFSAYEIVMMGRNPYQKRFAAISKEDIKKVEEAMKLASCEDLKEKEFKSLSGGEAQRVIIARAIAQDTPWLFLDEPVSNLDIKHQLELMKTLCYLREKKNVSIVAVLHDINLAATYCSHIIMMKKGNILYTGKTEEIMTEHHLKETYEIDFTMIHHPKTGKTIFIP